MAQAGADDPLALAEQRNEDGHDQDCRSVQQAARSEHPSVGRSDHEVIEGHSGRDTGHDPSAEIDQQREGNDTGYA